MTGTDILNLLLNLIGTIFLGLFLNPAVTILVLLGIIWVLGEVYSLFVRFIRAVE